MPDLTLRLEETSDEPIYMQLYRYIKREIAAGRIKAGSRLPSVRNLAARLGVSRTPVSLAYDQLQAEGYVISRPRSGLFAAEIDPAPGDAAARRTAAVPVRTPPSLHRAYHAASDTSALYDFGYGSVDLSHFPLKKWTRLLSACFRPENGRTLLYGDYQGEPGLRAELAAYLHQHRGVRSSPEQIVVGAGTYH
jgi:GntR family transcriptional regulator/MocR family aminotransferase